MTQEIFCNRCVQPCNLIVSWTSPLLQEKSVTEICANRRHYKKIEDRPFFRETLALLGTLGCDISVRKKRNFQFAKDTLTFRSSPFTSLSPLKNNAWPLSKGSFGEPPLPAMQLRFDNEHFQILLQFPSPPVVQSSLPKLSHFYITW